MRVIVLNPYGTIVKEKHGNFETFLKAARPYAHVSRFREAVLGRISYEQFMSQYNFSYVKAAGEDYVEHYLTFDPDFYDFARRCKKEGVKLVICANDVAEWTRHILDYYHLNEYVDAVCVSSETHVDMPEDAMYHAVFRATGASARECTVVDHDAFTLVTSMRLFCNDILFDRDSTDPRACKSFRDLSVSLFGQQAEWVKGPYRT